ncbi:unnamed protein product, partial [Polarella glacialis]
DAEAQSECDAECVSVRLLVDPTDPCAWWLQVKSPDQSGLLFKICEVLQSHGVDVCSAVLTIESGLVDNQFELKVARPSEVTDAADWCAELEDFLVKNRASGGVFLQRLLTEGSMAAASRKLHVNPDLLSVVSFRELAREEGPQEVAIHYHLEIEGINQAGLLTYAAL